MIPPSRIVFLTGLFAVAATSSNAAQVIHYWDFDTLSAGAPVDVVGGLATTNDGTPDYSVHATYGSAYGGAGNSFNTVLSGGDRAIADVYAGTAGSGTPTAMLFGSSDFSFSYWSYDASNLDGDVRGPRVFDSLTGTTVGLQLGSDGSGIFNYRTDDDATNFVLSNSTLTTLEQTDGSWVHIAVNVGRSTDTAEVFFDGASQGTYGIAALTGNVEPSQDLWIGAINNAATAGGQQQSGLDDLAFYTGLLSTSDLAGLAAGTLTPDQIPEPSAVILSLGGVATMLLRRRRS